MKTFKYPEGNRMCAAGQRRAAIESMNLFLPGGEDRTNELLEQACRTQHQLEKGADVPKRNKIILEVFEHYTANTLGDYIDPSTGNYTLETYDGRKFSSNILRDLENKKRIY